MLRVIENYKSLLLVGVVFSALLGVSGFEDAFAEEIYLGGTHAEIQDVCENKLNGTFRNTVQTFDLLGYVDMVSCHRNADIGSETTLIIEDAIFILETPYPGGTLENNGKIIVEESGVWTIRGGISYVNYGEIEVYGTVDNPNIPPLLDTVSTLAGYGWLIGNWIGFHLTDCAVNNLYEWNSGHSFQNEGSIVIHDGGVWTNGMDFHNTHSGIITIETDGMLLHGIPHKFEANSTYDHDLFCNTRVPEHLWSEDIPSREFVNDGSIFVNGVLNNIDELINEEDGLIQVDGGQLGNLDDNTVDSLTVEEKNQAHNTIENLDGDGIYNYGQIEIINGGVLNNFPPHGSLITDIVLGIVGSVNDVCSLLCPGNFVVDLITITTSLVLNNAFDSPEAFEAAGTHLEDLCHPTNQIPVGWSSIENHGSILIDDSSSMFNGCFAMIKSGQDSTLSNYGNVMNWGVMDVHDVENNGEFVNLDPSAGYVCEWERNCHLLGEGGLGGLHGSEFVYAEEFLFGKFSISGHFKNKGDFGNSIGATTNIPGIFSNWEDATTANNGLFIIGPDSQTINVCRADFENYSVVVNGLPNFEIIDVGGVPIPTPVEPDPNPFLNYGDLDPHGTFLPQPKNEPENKESFCPSRGVTLRDANITKNNDEEGDNIKFTIFFRDQVESHTTWNVQVDFGDGTSETATKKSATPVEARVCIDPVTGLFILCFSHWDVEYTVKHRYGDNDKYEVSAIIKNSQSKITANDGMVVFEQISGAERTEDHRINNVIPTVVIDNILKCKDIPNDDLCEDQQDVYINPINERGTINLTGEFRDSGWLDTFESATVNWGDGTPIENLAINNLENDYPRATATYGTSHLYGDNGEFTIEVCVDDDDGGHGCKSETLTVNNVVPEFISAYVDTREEYLLENNEIQFWVDIYDRGSDDVYVTYDWDDETYDSELFKINSPEMEPPVLDPFPSPTNKQAFVFPEPTHTWGDNGEFDVEVCAWDDDMLLDGPIADEDKICEIIPVTIDNVNPTAEIDETELLVVQTVPTFMGKVFEPVDFTAHSTDPGSDDLQFTWDWDDPKPDTVTMYHVNIDNTQPDDFVDPLPSPSIQPRNSIEDSHQHTYDLACLYHPVLTLDDDDTGTQQDTAPVVIVGDVDDIRPAGDWQTDAGKIISGKGKTVFTEMQFQCLLNIASHMSAIYDEERSISSIEDSFEVMNDADSTNLGEQFDRQILVAWLNFANGAITLDEQFDTDKDKVLDKTFAEIMQEAEDARLDPSSTTETTDDQKNILVKINETKPIKGGGPKK